MRSILLLLVGLLIGVVGWLSIPGQYSQKLTAMFSGEGAGEETTKKEAEKVVPVEEFLEANGAVADLSLIHISEPTRPY